MTEEHRPVESASQALDSRVIHSWLEISPDPLVIVNANGKVLYANRMALSLLGSSTEVLVNSDLWETYPPDKVSHHKTIVNRVIRTGHPIGLTDQIGDHWYHVLFSPLLDSQRQAAQIAICYREITKQITAEEQLKRTNLVLITLQEDERRRISQDLHDDIGQTLTALMMSLTQIDRALNGRAKDVGTQIKETLIIVEDLMKRMRQIFYQLRPPSLQTLTLSQALQSYCASYSRQTGLKVIFRGQDNLPDLTDLQATALYRFVQEGLNNAAKHAQATSVWVNLDYAEGAVDLALEDDGQGFDLHIIGDQMGLRGIRERFLMLGGTFDIESAPGAGTRLSGSLPIGPKDE